MASRPRPRLHRPALPVALAAAFLTLLAPHLALGQAGAEPPTPAESADSLGRTYGTPGEDAAYALAGLADGGFAIAGSISLGDEAAPAWWLRFDRHSLPVATRLYAPADSGGIYGMVPLRDGDILAFGDASGDGEVHAALHRLTPDGAARWTAVADSVPGYGYGMAAVELPDGDIVFAVEGSDESEAPFAMLIRGSGDGSRMLWQRRVPQLEDVAGLFLLPDGSLVAAGNGTAGDSNEIRFVGIGADGSSTLRATVAADGGISAYRALPLPDGDVVLAVDLSDAEDAPGGVLRAGPDGQLRWLRPIGAAAGLVEALAVVPAGHGSDGGVAVAGALRDRGGEQDAFAGLLSPDGEWRWARRFAGPRDTLFNAIAARPDGDFLAAGTVLETAPRPDWHAAEQDEDGVELRDQNAWLMALSATGEPVAATEPVQDPLLREVADEMGIAAGRLFSGANLGGPVLAAMAPPAFRQDGDALVMATAPLVAGPLLVNVSRTRFTAADSPGLAAAETVLAEPLLQAPADGGEAVVEADRQRISWRYALGTFLAERSQIALEGIRLFGPDRLRIEIAALQAVSESQPRPDGSWDLDSRVELRALSGGGGGDPLAAEDGSWFRVGGERLELSSDIAGLDVGAYAAAVRAFSGPDAPVQLQDYARSFAGALEATGLTYQDATAGTAHAARLDRFAAEVAMTRPVLAAPLDLRIGYGLDGLDVSEDGAMVARLGRGRLTVTGTDWNLAALQQALESLEEEGAAEAEQEPVPDPDAAEAAALDRFLGALGGAGLELTGSDVAIGLDEGRAGFAAARIGLAVQGVRDNAASLRLGLSGAGIAAAPAPMDLAPDLMPTDLELDLTLGPLPLRDMAAALLAGDEDGMPAILARAAPMLEIPRLALVAEAGEVHGEGSFAFDAANPAMLTGRMTLLVVQLENLRKRLAAEAPKEERAMIGGIGGYLEGLAESGRSPGGRPASRFEVVAQPNGAITVNGLPFPPGDAGAGALEGRPEEPPAPKPERSPRER